MRCAVGAVARVVGVTCLLTGLLLGAPAQAADHGTASPQQLTILHTSDIHGAVLPYDDLRQTPAAGSLVQIASLVKRIRQEIDHPVLLLDSGDTLQGTPFEEHANARWMRISPTIEAMSRMEYLAMAVGNHEFNFGLEVLRRSEAQAEFPFLSANTLLEASGQPAFTPYIVVEAEQVRVGILGLTTSNIPAWEQPASYQGLRFERTDRAAPRWVEHLRNEEQCDLVVVLAHTGFERGLDPSDSAEISGGASETAADDPENFAWRLARVPGIDLLLTGHTHKSIPPRRLGQTIVSQPSARARTITRIDLELRREGLAWQISGWQGSNISTANESPDPALTEHFRPLHEEVLAALDETIGETTGIISVNGCRLHDCSALDLIHAAQLDASGADVSLAAILSDSTPDAGPGGISRRWVHGLYVYPNVPVSLELKGSEIKDVLEHSARFYQGLDCASGAGCTLRVDPEIPHYNVDSAAGVTYRIDPNQPIGERVRDLRFRGEPIDPDASFVVITNSYRATGGGEFPHLPNAKVIWQGDIETKDLIERFLEQHQPWTPTVDGSWSIGPDLGDGSRNIVSPE